MQAGGFLLKKSSNVTNAINIGQAPWICYYFVMQENTELVRSKLLKEKQLLEKELETIGRRNPDNPADWEAVPPEARGEADKNIAADMIEGFEEAYATEGELEQRLAKISSALERIDKGTYGICQVCGKQIEEERLMANPAATTRVAHRND